MKGKYEKVAAIRIKLLEFISAQNFDHTYVIKDEISKNIACTLYPLINELETLLRGYLMKFFITKLGPKWWDITADSEMKQKARLRKKNEQVFSNYIDNKVYLIDFGELGKMIYALSSGYINKNDIIDKLMNIEESIDAIKELKQELQSNYTKYFKETFKDKQFQKKWEDIEKLRHKVAHNNLFTEKDLEKGVNDCNELKQIIEEADKTMDEIEFSEEEIEKITKDSLENINKLYGDFLFYWKSLVVELMRISNNHALSVKPQSIPVHRLLRVIHQKKLFSNRLFDQLIFLMNYRNMIVHNPSTDLFMLEKDLPEAIELMLKVIEDLKKIK